MAKVISIGQPANESERRAIGFLRDYLPEDWLIFHNFEMRQGQEVFEIDVAILAAHALYLVDIKGTHGNIDVYGSKWYPEGRQPFFSPLAKLRNHARAMATIVQESNTAQPELRKVHVHAAVLLTAPDAAISDPSGRDGPDVTDLKHCVKYFSDTSRIPEHRLKNILKHTRAVANAIQGKARPKTAAAVYRDWQVEERLGGTDRYTEYRAKHTLLGKRGGMARLRVYQADPYQDEQARKLEFQKISNAYRAVAHMPSHANILAVKEYFSTEEEDKVVLVTEDLPGQALRLHIKKPSMALTFDQKLQVMRDVLAALDHAHRHEVIHRNLTPDAILVTKGAQARVTGFDFARVGKHRAPESTVAGQIVEDLDPAYRAPELVKSERESFPAEATIASDIYSLGLIFYELLTGEMPFENTDQMMEADGKFPIPPSQHKPDLPKAMDDWLQGFCEFDAEERHASAAAARKALEDLIVPERKDAEQPEDDTPPAPAGQVLPEDLRNLPKDFVLADRFTVQEKLGDGGFGAVYKVFDAFSDVVRAIKIIDKDRRSVFERLRREYKTLANLPEHPHVVKVIWADRMSDVKQTPYMVFEYVEGLDVSELIAAEALSLDDAVRLVREAAEGLAHLHRHGVYHQDVKPSNLLWTEKGVRILDFNVAVMEKDEAQGGGGTRRYLPPDYDTRGEPTAGARVDRDLYALGISFYGCVTGGRYPFEASAPPVNAEPRDPRQFKGCADLSSTLVCVLMKMIAPARKDRYGSAEELLEALSVVHRYRAELTTGELAATGKAVADLGFEPVKPNNNPFVTHLLTLYSQSQVSNAGTRGLDRIGKATYVSTYLDERLKPGLLKGEFHLVIISGNAGDGKTAFIQQFEAFAESKGAHMQRGGNGAVFKLKGHTFQTNHDGSQDEGGERNDDVLGKFFAPFAGDDAAGWPRNQTRIIAINEGRLVDFFQEHEAEFTLLAARVRDGLSGTLPEGGVAVINLNLRSVVAETEGPRSSILERLVGRMTDPAHWTACESCDLKDKCYAFHNARTFQDAVAGPKVVERLRMLYTITHLRGRLHITMRDLRSALAYMLVGTRDCDGIHALYQNGGAQDVDRILDSFYFNAWLGGAGGSNDRLLALLREIDVAQVSNPNLDAELGFLAPGARPMSRFSFAERAGYDDALVATLFRGLPRDYSVKHRGQLIARHRNYLAHLRRRHFFERRDAGWKEMLPYESIDAFLAAIAQPGDKPGDEVTTILRAINRGERLSDPGRLGNQLALRVREVEKGTIRSYRLFPGEQFTLRTEHAHAAHPFLECLSPALLLAYDSGDGHKARLRITLDMYEMLARLNHGYRPSVEELEGFYLSLAVFKNVLAAVPYKEVLLTKTGHRFYEIRNENNVLKMRVSDKGGEPYHAG